MKRILSIISLAAILFTVTSCEENQKQEAKTREEIAQYSTNCVKSFLKKLYKHDESARDLCYAYTLSDGRLATLYDVATQLEVSWNPDEVNVQDNIETICTEYGTLKYVEVYANCQGKRAKFRVGFNKGMFNPLETTQPITFSGSEGRTVILDSEGFLPEKIADEENKQHVKFTFGSKNDMINYLMMKEMPDYSKRATAFFQTAIKGQIDYRDEYKTGRKIGKYTLVDSIKTAELIGFEYKQGMKDILDGIYTDGKIEIFGFPCVLKYTNGIVCSWGIMSMIQWAFLIIPLI